MRFPSLKRKNGATVASDESPPKFLCGPSVSRFDPRQEEEEEEEKEVPPPPAAVAATTPVIASATWNDYYGRRHELPEFRSPTFLKINLTKSRSLIDDMVSDSEDDESAIESDAREEKEEERQHDPTLRQQKVLARLPLMRGRPIAILRKLPTGPVVETRTPPTVAPAAPSCYNQPSEQEHKIKSDIEIPTLLRTLSKLNEEFAGKILDGLDLDEAFEDGIIKMNLSSATSEDVRDDTDDGYAVRKYETARENETSHERKPPPKGVITFIKVSPRADRRIKHFDITERESTQINERGEGRSERDTPQLERPEDKFDRVVAKGFARKKIRSGGEGCDKEGVEIVEVMTQLTEPKQQDRKQHQSISDVVSTLRSIRKGELVVAARTFDEAREKQEPQVPKTVKEEGEGCEISDAAHFALNNGDSPKRTVSTRNVLAKTRVNSIVDFLRPRRDRSMIESEEEGHLGDLEENPVKIMLPPSLQKMQAKNDNKARQMRTLHKTRTILRSVASSEYRSKMKQRRATTCSDNCHSEATEITRDFRDLRGVLPCSCCRISPSIDQDTVTLGIGSLEAETIADTTVGGTTDGDDTSRESSGIIFGGDDSSIETVENLIEQIKTGMTSALSGDDTSAGAVMSPPQRAHPTGHCHCWLC